MIKKISPTPRVDSAGMAPVAKVVLVAVLATAVALGLHRAIAGAPSSGKSPLAETDTAALVAKIGAHIVINTKESPTVATVNDAGLLRRGNPSFYKDAQNGDRLVIWSDKAVLYSTSKNLILAVMPLSVSATGGAPATPATIGQEAATVEIRNGSATPGLAKTLAEKLKAAGFTVSKPTDASRKTYDMTVLMKNNTKPFPESVQALLSLTGATFVPQPFGEATGTGDFLVVVGADAQR